MYFCDILIGIYLNIGHIDFLANVRMLKFGSELRYGIRSPNVQTPVDIPNPQSLFLAKKKKKKKKKQQKKQKNKKKKQKKTNKLKFSIFTAEKKISVFCMGKLS